MKRERNTPGSIIGLVALQPLYLRSPLTRGQPSPVPGRCLNPYSETHLGGISCLKGGRHGISVGNVCSWYFFVFSRSFSGLYCVLLQPRISCQCASIEAGQPLHVLSLFYRPSAFACLEKRRRQLSECAVGWCWYLRPEDTISGCRSCSSSKQ